MIYDADKLGCSFIAMILFSSPEEWYIPYLEVRFGIEFYLQNEHFFANIEWPPLSHYLAIPSTQCS